MSETLLDARNLSFAYGAQTVLREVSLSIQAGEFVALVGPNGSGKSTLLKLLLGLLASKGDGRVALNGRTLAGMRRIEVARHVAMVPQDTAVEFDFSVRDVVAMGRFPYMGRFAPETDKDRQAIDWALRATGTEAFAGRPVTELSGGERQRVMIARSVAQQTGLLLLDEPTANLDLEHQLELMQVVADLVGKGRAVVAALHDLSLAARYAGRIVVLHEGRMVADGTPREVVTEDNLAKYFRVQARVERDGERVLVWPVAPLTPARPAE